MGGACFHMTDHRSEAPAQSRRPTVRGASHVMAGFRYQLLQSVQALLSLREGEELLLEVSEDFTVVSKETVDDVQVKNSQAASGPPSFSLQSPEILTALNRYWEASETDALPRRLIFISRGGAGIERNHAFPDKAPGLRYWRAAAIDADTAPLRTSLIAILGDTKLGRWLASGPTDAELRDRLLRRVQWELDAVSADELLSQLREQVGEIYHSKNLPVSSAKSAVASLMDLVFEAASKPNADYRRLTKIAREQVLEECAGSYLVGQALAGVPASSTPILVDSSLVSELEWFTSPASRRDALDAVLSQTRGQPLVWIHGSNGIGKSTLARLAATKIGGRWLELDLRPVQTERQGSIAAWGQLTRAIALSEPFDGIIIDDFDGAAADALRSRLSALARSFGARGGRLIVTSHHQPSAAFLSDCGTSAGSSFQAPYFSETDVVELVNRDPRPAEDMVIPWAKFLQLTTNGGHPLMVAAKAASLRAQGWPDSSLIDDIVKPSEALRVTREEARRTLLSDLSSLDAARSLDAGDLLRRVSCVFGRVDEGLIRRLANASPALRTAGDALAVLKGSWLEELPCGDLRISPLLADLGRDIADEERKSYLSLAAEYWVCSGTLDARTLPLCFWNAFWGGHAWVLMKLCASLSSMAAETLRGAAALLSPITALTTEHPLLPSNLAVSIQLRLLQFEVANATEQGVLAATIARRLVQELDAIEPEELRVLISHTSMTKFLMAESAKLATKDRIAYALAIRETEPHVLALGEGAVPDPKTFLPPKFGDEMDMADILFSSIVQHIDSSSDELEAIQALGAIPQKERNRFLDAMSKIYEGDGVFVHSGWSRDQLSSGDMEAALSIYDRIQEMVAGWNREGFLLDVICARAVILDEGLARTDDAISVIDDAIATFGRNQALLRQKSKLLAHAERHHEAVEILLPIEDDLATQAPFDRTLVLRDGAVSAARAGRFPDALRMIDRAQAAILEVSGRTALAIGLLLEEALIRWRSDDRRGALAIVGNALERLSLLPDDESFQALRSHKIARGIVGLFFSELPGMAPDPTMPLKFGDASIIEFETKPPSKEALTTIADNMRILAIVEASLCFDVGIEARSASMQTGSVVLAMELLLRQKKFENAVRSGDPVAALRAGIAALWALTVRQNISRERQTARIPAEALIVPDLSVLVSMPGGDQKLDELIVDFVLFFKLNEQRRLDISFWNALREAAREAFGEAKSGEHIIDLLEGRRGVPSASSQTDAVAYLLGVADERLAADPALRFQRDVRLLQHVAQDTAVELLSPPFLHMIIRQWTFVIERQRFLLRNPSGVAADIEAALRELSSDRRLANVARLFVVCAPAVGVPFDEMWVQLLDRLPA
ncbi:hypothetical protein LCM4579_15295 [Ensifer sp. LCM 4579]|nr:hypothetical protein LCM4579_15295 [Ensifer sp. LCM 4579]